MARKLTKPPYKSEMNQWYTQSLFYDMQATVPKDRWVITPIFSLYEERPGYICCRTTFVELGDPTGYKWATKYLGDWQHWLRLQKCPWFVEAVEHWREELSVKIESEAVDIIKGIAAAEGKSQLPAARFLAELDKRKTGRGRPSKAEVDAELKRQVKVQSVEDDDMERIGLRVVNGGKSAQ